MTEPTSSGSIDGPFVSSRLLAETVVYTPDGPRVRVRVARMGVHRYSLLAGGPNFLAVIFTWVLLLLRQETRWTVTVARAGFWRYPPTVTETFPERQSAAERADELVERLRAGGAKGLIGPG